MLVALPSKDGQGSAHQSEPVKMPKPKLPEASAAKATSGLQSPLQRSDDPTHDSRMSAHHARSALVARLRLTLWDFLLTECALVKTERRKGLP